MQTQKVKLFHKTVNLFVRFESNVLLGPFGCLFRAQIFFALFNSSPKKTLSYFVVDWHGVTSMKAAFDTVHDNVMKIANQLTIKSLYNTEGKIELELVQWLWVQTDDQEVMSSNCGTAF